MACASSAARHWPLLTTGAGPPKQPAIRNAVSGRIVKRKTTHSGIVPASGRSLLCWLADRVNAAGNAALLPEQNLVRSKRYGRTVKVNAEHRNGRSRVTSFTDSRFAAFRGARAMITGGVGLIGSALARRSGRARRRGAAGRQHGAGGRRQPRQHRRRSATGCGSTSPISATTRRCGTCSPGRISFSTSRRRPATWIR